ncbi:probable RNA methyltransferase CG1239 isoform X1 [Drosophila serrata]|uniref:probable RNA methyltransferase CG1239 isoform X1 n=1 Tax=Drosophila serrata TaxID=7274 RepID=UPI000A1D3329|nr:probable RNA methyltransferase CG1239 isoform X1 [Drosophila serrata]XP_020812780.1 probable RNA methyltransferase CG1239 isoform X1 [Drosophila serrata]
MDVMNNNTLIEKKSTTCAEKRANTTFEDKETKRLKTDNDHVDIAPRPPPQSPKKRLQLNGKPKHNKDLNFVYGNYKNYYGKRILDKEFHDIRLDILGSQPEMFRQKQLLDIGCNSGHLSIQIARKFGVKSLVGLDIDRSLVKDAQTTINQLKGQTDTGAGHGFPHNIRFVQGNYVLEDDVLLEIERPQFDVILCLSVTKWIHLNFCDAGLKQAFRRIYHQLRPGGKLILEPQSIDGYKRRKKLSEQIRANYNSIQFCPEQFTEYLLSTEVGFANMELMGTPDHCEAGFKRPIQIFTKT